MESYIIKLELKVKELEYIIKKQEDIINDYNINSLINEIGREDDVVLFQNSLRKMHSITDNINKRCPL